MAPGRPSRITEPGGLSANGLPPAAPSKGPTVRTKKVGKNEAVLEWDQLPVDVQNGFIRNYTIFYRTSAGNETGNAAACRDPSSWGPEPPH